MALDFPLAPVNTPSTSQQLGIKYLATTHWGPITLCPSTFTYLTHHFNCPTMQSYHHDPSLSSATSRDLETGTLASQNPSTVPTSTLPPRLPMMSFVEHSNRNPQTLANSNTLPAMFNRDDRKSRALPSSATWTSSSGDLAIVSDTDEIQDRQIFVREYNRLAKKVHGCIPTL